MAAHALSESQFSSVPADRDAFHSSVAEARWFGAGESIAPSPALQRIFEGVAIAGLRPLPDAAAHALALLRRTPFERAPVVELVRRDIALATKVVRYANTVFGSSNDPAGTLADAVERLGWRVLPGLVASVASEPSQVDQDAAREIHRHSQRVAAIVRALAVRHRVRDPEGLYLCGLLHEVGRLCILEIEDPAVPPPRVDPAAIGAHILSRWGFPERIVKVVGWQDETGRPFLRGGDLGERVCWLHVADQLEALLRRRDTFDLNRAMAVLDNPYARYIDYHYGDLERDWSAVASAANGCTDG